MILEVAIDPATLEVKVLNNEVKVFGTCRLFTARLVKVALLPVRFVVAKLVPVAFSKSKLVMEANIEDRKFVTIELAVVVPVNDKLFKELIVVVEIIPFTLDTREFKGSAV
jgi:hypothetical protein